MAQSDAEKTEYPTPRRISRARSEGNVPKSVELNSAAVLITGTLLLYILMRQFLKYIFDFFTIIWGEIPYLDFSVMSLQKYFIAGLLKIGGMLAPFMLSLMVIGVAVNILQSGWNLTLKPVMPKLTKLNPINGLSRFISVSGLVDLLRNIAKISLVGLVAYWTVKAEFLEFLPLMDMSLGQITTFIGLLTYKVAIRISLMILAIGIIDYIWTKYRYIKGLKMTKQEVKDEARQSEGPPEVKREVRKVQVRAAMQRMMRDVPSAEVVITNPTHLAVALKYEGETMAAPMVVAKGARLLAEKIKRIAMEHDIPIVENQPLAQALFKSVEVGEAIPPQFYAAVAEILAFVYRLKEERHRKVEQ